jgi:hypothetical protein
MGSVRDKMVEQIRAAKRAASSVVQKIPVEMVRARNEEGHFVKDDPNTPENEAWVEKPKAKKKEAAKAPAKKRGRPRKKV